MKTSQQIETFITTLLINDLNMLTVKSNHGIAMMADNTDKRLPVIEITFKDITKSNYQDTLNKDLKRFLEDQNFQLIPLDEDNTILVLLF